MSESDLQFLRVLNYWQANSSFVWVDSVDAVLSGNILSLVGVSDDRSHIFVTFWQIVFWLLFGETKLLTITFLSHREVLITVQSSGLWLRCCRKTHQNWASFSGHTGSGSGSNSADCSFIIVLLAWDTIEWLKHFLKTKCNINNVGSWSDLIYN